MAAPARLARPATPFSPSRPRPPCRSLVMQHNPVMSPEETIMSASLQYDGKTDFPAKMAKPQPARGFSPTPYIAAGYLTILMGFGGFGTWAALAPIASGVVASGTVSVESNRKTVQHLEGGIVSEIVAKEG